MMSTPALGPTERPSILTFNKSTLIIWVAISLIVSETLAGAMRYYFDQVGISPLLYLPKIACLILFAAQLLTYKASRVLWVGLLMLLVSCALAMLHGASFTNVAFSLFGFSPLLFGAVCSEHILHRKRLLGWVIGVCLILSLIGLLLDKYTTVPWKGYSYLVGNTELVGNTAWADDEFDRLAGFTRVSNALSIVIAIFSLYLAMFTRSRILFCIIAAVGFYAIVLTTSKAPAAAFALTLGVMALSRLRWTSATLFVGLVAIGFLLPIIGVAFDFDPNNITSGDRSLTSLYDRLINTWPHVAQYLYWQGWSLTGAGLGMFGSSQVLFPVPGAQILTGSDSSAMYLWATFGFVGLALYAMQIPLFFMLRDKTSRLDNALLAISICICLTSWTTDMFEITLSNLFMGVAIGRVLYSSAATSTVTTKAHGLGELSELPELR
ncbi:hypothetical protein QN382_22000 [Pseudomonas sp. 10B1]|uniref:O-antigen ligase family protein n=1 Tax=unclassified Pseudomonas TaxID=196821 RepID=UPI002AB5AD10|nr:MULTISPECIES: hypothetical protein [unclassified Pseudomonas]MDY7562617.1 hypothetical protein [Pseudomonas sp. AB6]MEA9979774.1 hypothetical protein [Pseudomonas sp. RTS4]MEA9995817.1 hypothetical protein [Pseudomonas sp. AA4]MEB0087425.1 hypothetical protein [Pseudomonas sp. RTI1]MEB0127811.1 hypothetical protein [Pseudomonas sp. CCC1.2]